MRILWFDPEVLEVIRTGRLFFQPFDRHHEPAELLAKLGRERLALVMVATADLEPGLDPIWESASSTIADLDRMDLESRGQL